MGYACVSPRVPGKPGGACLDQRSTYATAVRKLLAEIETFSEFRDLFPSRCGVYAHNSVRRLLGTANSTEVTQFGNEDAFVW